ncbi:hypothetical protein SeMB42_g07541 [Synchytrium endobioticum]|uniref:Uncharacterized protein n=1 Tax=Synchytrium endobioticum TaxID=286115 RepID=A0A507C6E1_9FUNG|nr:hypothetical protein SeMB42_g07541 [Synchytrium endobioticum]
MANIVRGYLEHDERPAYLKPPSKDKNTPMKRKADEGGTLGWPEQESKDSLGGVKSREKVTDGSDPAHLLISRFACNNA